MATVHTPVLLDEVLSYLAVAPNKDYIDGTIGGGGHAEAILKATGPNGKLLGLDADPQAIVKVEKRLQQFGNRVILQNKNYKQINNILDVIPDSFSASGILLDLGLSSDQLDTSGRGFSFSDEGPIDMRFDTSQGRSAAQFIAEASEAELGRVFREYGEIRQWKRLAKAFSTFHGKKDVTVPEVVFLVTQIIPRGKSRIHPATTVFQALRIAVNEELLNLETFLEQALTSLPVGTRIVIISFHSLEDRIVKHFFKTFSQEDYGPKESPLNILQRPAYLKTLTKKVIKATAEEIASNPRSRSAVLRAAEIIERPHAKKQK